MPQAVRKERIRSQTRELPTLYTRASIVENSYDEATRTIDVVWSTGAKGLRRSYWEGDYYEELSLDPAHVRLERLNGGAPVLDTHNQWGLSGVIGVVVEGSARVDGTQGTAKLRLSKREDLAPIIQDIIDGIIRNISVGYNVYTYEITETAGDKIPTYRAIDWEPAELSFVPVGFDAGAQSRNAAPQHTVQIITRGTAAHVEEEETMTPEELAAAEAEKTRIANEQKAARELAEKQARERAAASEKTRILSIRGAVRAANLGNEVEDELVNGDFTIEAAREIVLTKLAERQKKAPTTTAQSDATIEVVSEQRDKWLEQAFGWMVIRSGMTELFSKAGQKVDAGNCRGMSMADLARSALENMGVNVKGMDRMRMVGMALTHRTAYNGTSDFSVLLENVMNKTLLNAFATQPDTWTRFCKRGSVSDFRPHNRYRQGSFGSLDKVNENGEFTQKQIPDGSKESVSINTKGNIIGLTRQAIIDDDMSAFSDLAQRLGRAAKLSIEKDVYATLALNSGLGPLLNDGLPIFDAAHLNISTSAALTAAAIDLDRILMGSQYDMSGNELLDINPKVLLVSKALGSKARVINRDQYDPDTEANRAQLRSNVVQNLFDDIVDTARLTGNRRYLFADPNIAPVLEVSFLDGNDTPYMETKDGWRVDGIEWKIRLDWGVDGVGYNGAVTNAGG